MGSIPGLEDPLEKEMATHSSNLVREISWTEEPGGLQPWGYKRAKHNLTTKTAAAKSYTEVSKQVPTSFRLSFFISNPISQRCYEERKEKCEVIHTPKLHKYGFPGGSAVKNSPTIQETRVRSLGLEDLL